MNLRADGLLRLRLTHGALPWRGAHERRSVLYRYIPGSMAYVAHRSGPEQYGYLSTDEGWPSDWLEGMNAEQLALMAPPFHPGARPHFDLATVRPPHALALCARGSAADKPVGETVQGKLSEAQAAHHRTVTQGDSSKSPLQRFARQGDGTPQEPLTQANYEEWRRKHTSPRL